jgi:hypothetical protein
MKLLKFQVTPPGAQADTISHGGQVWVVSNSSGLVLLPDEVANFMLQDGRSGCVLVEDPPGPGELLRCPCCHHAWRRTSESEEE